MYDSPQSTELAALDLPFYAHITGNDGIKFHSWYEVYPASVATFATLTAARSGTTTACPIYAMNGGLFPTGSIVECRRAYYDTTNGWVYVGTGYQTGATPVCPGYPFTLTLYGPLVREGLGDYLYNFKRLLTFGEDGCITIKDDGYDSILAPVCCNFPSSSSSSSSSASSGSAFPPPIATCGCTKTSDGKEWTASWRMTVDGFGADVACGLCELINGNGTQLDWAGSDTWSGTVYWPCYGNVEIILVWTGTQFTLSIYPEGDPNPTVWTATPSGGIADFVYPPTSAGDMGADCDLTNVGISIDSPQLDCDLAVFQCIPSVNPYCPTDMVPNILSVNILAAFPSDTPVCNCATTLADALVGPFVMATAGASGGVWRGMRFNTGLTTLTPPWDLPCYGCVQYVLTIQGDGHGGLLWTFIIYYLSPTGWTAGIIWEKPIEPGELCCSGGDLIFTPADFVADATPGYCDWSSYVSIHISYLPSQLASCCGGGSSASSSSSAGGGSITDGCCGTINTTLYLRASSSSCFTGAVTLIYNPSTSHWVGSTTPSCSTCFGTLTYTLRCVSGSGCAGYILDQVCSGGGGSVGTTPTMCSCSPLSLTYVDAATGVPGDTITITET